MKQLDETRPMTPVSEVERVRTAIPSENPSESPVCVQMRESVAYFLSNCRKILQFWSAVTRGLWME